MNNYGQPSGPEVAMLDELHRLWGRVFGRSHQPEAKRGQRLPLLALVVVAAAVVVVRMVAF